MTLSPKEHGATRHPTLPELLVARAHSASDTRLALDAAAGIVVALVLALWRPPAWYVLFAAALCVGFYGLWGMIDRELGERSTGGEPRGSGWLHLARWTAAAAGVLSAIALLLGLLGAALGTWIS
jgi:hypothetical protein